MLGLFVLVDLRGGRLSKVHPFVGSSETALIAT